MDTGKRKWMELLKSPIDVNDDGILAISSDIRTSFISMVSTVVIVTSFIKSNHVSLGRIPYWFM